MFVGLQLFVGHISDEKPRTSHTDRLHIRYQGVWQLVNFYTHKKWSTFMDTNGDRIVIWWYYIYYTLHYITLYYATFYYIILYFIVYYIVLYFIILYYIVLYYIILYYNYIILHYVIFYLVGGAITILKNDGLRQWETSYPI
jgi:hypothetical protein